MNALFAEAIFHQLMRAFAASQNFARADVLKRQTALLERLVRHADAHVPFYRESHRLRPLFRADGAFDFAGWKDVPILTRNEAKENQEALLARIVPSDMGELETNSTSGSTGTPLKFRRTLVQKVASEVLLNRLLLWHGLWPIQRVAVPGDATAADEPGPGMLKLPGADFGRTVELLRRNRTTHVIAPPSLAAAWADIVEPGDLPDLIALVATGEVLRPETRTKIERKLKVKVVDLYSSSELGPVAGEGPEGRLRVNEEIALLEGPLTPVEHGTPTRVIVTPFYAFGMPLIRYAPGDYVRFSGATTKDARGLRSLREVIGRQRNLFRRPDGRQFLPGRIVARQLAAILDCREWQLVQTSLSEITLRIVVPHAPNDRQWSDLRNYVQKSLPDHDTNVVIVEKIENQIASGKAYEMFLSLIE